MTDTTQTTPEMELQLLTAQDGTAYLLPRAVVEAVRLTPEEAAAFAEAERSGDVQGFWASPLRSMEEQAARDHQSDQALYLMLHMMNASRHHRWTEQVTFTTPRPMMVSTRGPFGGPLA